MLGNKGLIISYTLLPENHTKSYLKIISKVKCISYYEKSLPEKNNVGPMEPRELLYNLILGDGQCISSVLSYRCVTVASPKSQSTQCMNTSFFKRPIYVSQAHQSPKYISVSTQSKNYNYFEFELISRAFA